MTEPDFSGKFSFSEKWGKRAQKVPKIGFFILWRKIESLVLARNDIK